VPRLLLVNDLLACHETSRALIRIALDGGQFGLADAFGDAEHFVLAQNQVLLPIQLDVGPGVLPDQHILAGFDVERNDRALVVDPAVADGDDLGNLRFFLGAIGNDDPADAR
jgi:hypothetical protein